MEDQSQTFLVVTISVKQSRLGKSNVIKQNYKFITDISEQLEDSDNISVHKAHSK
jgi:hypothetical protein